MKFAIIECATSDKLDYRLPADDASQPRLAQLAIIYLDNWQVPFVHTVKPAGWSMAMDAAAASGLTDDVLLSTGEDVSYAVEVYRKTVAAGYAIVSYSTSHTLKIMRGECRRAGVSDLFEHTSSIEIMRALTDVCRIPNVGRKGYKMPKMSEALAHFRIEAPEVRDASKTASLTWTLFNALVDLRRLPEPKLSSGV